VKNKASVRKEQNQLQMYATWHRSIPHQRPHQSQLPVTCIIKYGRLFQ